MTSSEKRMLLPILRKLANHEKLNHRAQSAAEQLYARLTRKSEKKVQGRLRREQQRTSSRASHNQETAKIRYQCMARAGIGNSGYCECGCRQSLLIHGEEMDHFYGRARGQSVKTCWILTPACHRKKTENDPSRAHWDEWFKIHCQRYGYEFTPRLIHADPAKAGGAP